jgi:hypothetical protein
MLLRNERNNGCKKAEPYADESSCSHRIDVEVCYPANCRTNRCRASASLACSRRPAGGVWAHREEQSKTRFAQRSGYSLTDRNRSAFAITETELKLIAAPAIIGLIRMPNSG